jgi:hypothetical protein
LFIIDDYFEGAGDSPVGTNELAQSAPAAIVRFHHFDRIIDNFQGAAGADADTQTANLAFFFIYYRHVTHVDISMHIHILYLIATFVCDISLIT